MFTLSDFNILTGEVGPVVTNPDKDTSHPKSEPLPFSPLPYVSQKTCQLSSVHSQGLRGNVGHLSLTTVVRGGNLGHLSLTT